MSRFIAGLACGAWIVGAAWFVNRVGHQQTRADVAAARRPAARLRQAAFRDPPRECRERRDEEKSVQEPPAAHPKVHRKDPDAPWKPIPPEWISAKERAELVKKMEAKHRLGPPPRP